MAKAKLTQDKVAQALSEAGIRLFKERSGMALNQAQRNLEARTHYADDAQLKQRNVSIVSTHVLDEGLILGIVESFKESADSARLYRPVFFDLFGNVVASLEPKDSHDNQRKATIVFWEMAEELHAIDLNMDGISTKQAALMEEVQQLTELAKTIKG